MLRLLQFLLLVLSAMSATKTPTLTITPTPTPTTTITLSGTASPSPSPTPTTTTSPTPTTSGTITNTFTPTGTLSPTVTSSPSPTPTSTDSASSTPTATFTLSATQSASPTPTSTATSTPTPTTTFTPTVTFSPTPSPSPTPTTTVSPTPSPTPTPSQTPTPTSTPTPTTTFTRTATATPTPVPTRTGTDTPTPTETTTLSPSATPSSTVTVSPTPTPTITLSASATPTPTTTFSTTYTPTGTNSFIPTMTASSTATFLNVFYSSTILAKGRILQPLTVGCIGIWCNSSQVYLAPSCASVSYTSDSSSTTSSLPLSLKSTANTNTYVAMVDTTLLAAGTYELCFPNATSNSSVDAYFSVVIQDYTSVSPTSIAPLANQTLSLSCTPSCVPDSASVQDFILTTRQCSSLTATTSPSSDVSPIAVRVGGSFLVDASGLNPTTGAVEPYKVCFRQRRSLARLAEFVDTLLRVSVSATRLVSITSPAIGRGIQQTLEVVCTGCSVSDAAVYLGSAEGCTFTGKYTPIAFLTQVSASSSTALLDTSDLTAGLYHVCFRNAVGSFSNSGLVISVLGTVVLKVSSPTPEIIAAQSGQAIKITCSSCQAGDSIYITTAACVDSVTPSFATSDSVALVVSGGDKTATINAANLNPGSYFVCYKAITSQTYANSNLRVNVTGTPLIVFSPAVAVHLSSQQFSYSCCQSCGSGCQGFVFFTRSTCLLGDQDPVRSSTTTERVATTTVTSLTGTVNMNTSAIIDGVYKVCFRPNSGTFSDTGFSVEIVSNIISAVSPSTALKSSAVQLALTCAPSSASCTTLKGVYLTSDLCWTNSSFPPPSTTTSPPAIISVSGTVVQIDASALNPLATYRVCSKTSGSFSDSGRQVFLRSSPVVTVSPLQISKAANQRIFFTCTNGCDDGSSVYITTAACSTTSTNAIVGSTTSAVDGLQNLWAFIDASGLTPTTGYRVCFRGLTGPYAFTGVTLEVRDSSVTAIMPSITPIESWPTTLTLQCGQNCADDDLVAFNIGSCPTGQTVATGSTSTSGQLILRNLQVILNTVNLKSPAIRSFEICYRQASGNWQDTGLNLQLTPTAIISTTPQAISKAIQQTITIKCNADCGAYSRIYITTDPCLTDSTTPIATLWTSAEAILSGQTASIDASKLVSPQSYQICFRKTNGNWQYSAFNVTVQPTILTSVSPLTVARQANQAIAVGCTTTCPLGFVYLTALSCVTTRDAPIANGSISPQGNISVTSVSIATVDASGLNLGSYKLCFRPSLSDPWQDSSFVIGVFPTSISSATPTQLVQSKTQTVTLTCGNCQLSDSVYLSSGSCSGGVNAPANSSTVSATSSITSQNTVVLDTSALSSGTYTLCYKAAGDVYRDTQISIGVSANAGGCDPTSTLKCSVVSTDFINVVVAGGSAVTGEYRSSDAVMIVLDSTTSNAAVTFTAITTTFTIISLGSANGVLTSRTSTASNIAALGCPLPSGVSENDLAGDFLHCKRTNSDGSRATADLRYSQRLKSVPRGLLRVLRMDTSCRAVYLSVTIVNLVITVTSPATSSGKLELLASTGDILVPVVSTPSDAITSLTPSTINGNASATISAAGAATGDKIGFTQGDCSAIAPSLVVTDSSLTVPAGLAKGTYNVCLQQSGRSDSVQQTGVTLTVSVGTTTTSSSSSSLSGGAIAGIVIGSVVGGLILIGIVAALLWMNYGGSAPAAAQDLEAVSYDENTYKYPTIGAPTPASTPMQFPLY